ncbi:MAG: hypothetical protein KGM47_06520 [Acidobacteriota bacterium]|nr:hypothetical protein [Acidobacteriota bacterium]
MMNRREFVRDSLLSSLTGLAGGDILLNDRHEHHEDPELKNSRRAPGMKHRVYAHLLDPREHPDYTRHHIHPPNWDTFGGRTQFATLRDFKIVDGKIVDYAAKIAKYTEEYELGKVLWPSYPILFAENLSDLVDEIKRRRLYLFDIWDYVPGSGPGSGPQQFQPSAVALELLQTQLGDHWLGMDNGEQDGRYIGLYAEEMYPSSGSRLLQYVNFQRFFERLTSQLGDKMSTLVSLNFGHYFLKEGLYTLIGAETGQALPNGQVFYVFIRGAGKQYGVPWFGNASGWNRWGWKEYGLEEHLGQVEGGPTKGTSLSLLKRLMYSQILYNSMLAGFDQGWFYRQGEASAGGASQDQTEDEKLSPIGDVQRGAARWIRETGQPGAMVTPVALMLDFFAGWTFPRQLYTSNVYRVWGNLPYGPGDYLTDGVLDMLYPGYQNSSYFHDESGFLTPTPYGDGADCFLSDAPGWLLARYPVLVIAGELEGGSEMRDKFETYVKEGGRLLITAGNLAKLPEGLAGINVEGRLTHLQAGESIEAGETSLVEDGPFDVYPLSFPKGAHLRARISGIPIAVEMGYGKGWITVLANPFGVGAKEAAGAQAVLSEDVKHEVDHPLAKPYPLLKHVRKILDEAFRGTMLFEAGEGLSLITCRKSAGEYTLGVSNNAWRQQPLKIVSQCGRIESLRELPLDQSEKGAVGYLPEGLENVDLGVSGKNTIAGGDIRIFTVKVREENMEEIAHVAPPARSRGRAIVLREARSIKEEVLFRPTFFEHFDSVVVDWRFLHQRDKEDLKHENKWMRLQKLKLFVDLTSGINLYPCLRLLDNIKADYLFSLAVIEGVMEKMEILRSDDLILSLHRYPENNFTYAQCWQSFETTLRNICERARDRQLMVHLRLGLNKPPEDLSKAAAFIERVGAPNLRLAPSTAFLLVKKTDPSEARKALEGKVGLWLVDTPRFDVVGRVWNGHAPIRGYKEKRTLANILRIDPEAPFVLDVAYKNHDEEYLDIKLLQEMLTHREPTA